MSAKEDVINHLLFHKALVENDESGQRFDDYIKMVEGVATDVNLRITDPFDEAIAQMLQLAIKERFDPWNIDLIRFSKMYLKRIRKSNSIDLITAGRLMFMAWSILKIQSDELLIRAEPVRDEDDNVVDIFWYPDYMDEPYDMEGDRVFNSVMGMEYAPLQKSITHNALRPVTLMELLDTGYEGRREAVLQLKINEIRERNRNNRKPPQIGKNVHREGLAEDILKTWETICGFGCEDITLHQLLHSSEQDLITMFVSLLFLAKEKKIKLWQHNFPHGDIQIRKMSDAEVGEIEIVSVLTGQVERIHVDDLLVA